MEVVMSAPITSRSLMLLLAVSPLASGCSQRHSAFAPNVGTSSEEISFQFGGPPIAPPGASPGAFLPLELGNEWSYEGRIVELSTIHGVTSRSETAYDLVSNIACTDEIDGRAYFVQRDTQIFGNIGFLQWIRYRQTQTGLYEADVSVSTPSSCDIRTPSSGVVARVPARTFTSPAIQVAYDRAREQALAKLDLVYALWRPAPKPGPPGGAAANELTRLAYPLRVGARWVIRGDPRFMASVVGYEWLDLPAGRMAGFKIRITSELFGPGDRVYSWVSRDGFLKFSAEVSSPITDETGVIGRLDYSEVRDLTALTLGTSPIVATVPKNEGSE
jgi:hypothetical protein